MTSLGTFPPVFESLRSISGGKASHYLVGAMFTDGYAPKAERLAASCETFGVPYELHAVPAVHNSIHNRGTADPSFTKPNFIHHLLTRHRKPVLYVDADCEFLEAPVLLDQLVVSGRDFAIYNWLADEHTDAFKPVEIRTPNGVPIQNQFYAYRHSIDYYSVSQLICSGAVQLYGNTAAARMLLSEWHKAILDFPGTVDDVCLDFAFNNLGPRVSALKPYWLPKAYARYSWWIYAKPVINHPDVPNPESPVLINDSLGRKHFYPERTVKRTEVRLFPRDCIIDTQQRMIYRIVGSDLFAISPTDQSFWL